MNVCAAAQDSERAHCFCVCNLDLDPKAAQWQLLGIYRSIEYSATPELAQLLLHPVPWKMQDAEATGRLAFFFAVMPLLFGRIIEFE